MNVSEIYDKMGMVLKEIWARRGPATTFTSSEVYPLWVQLYPNDEEMKIGKLTLKQYLPGMVWEYSRKAYSLDPDKPAIEFLGKKTYRFVSNLINDNSLSKQGAAISHQSSGNYLPTKDDFESAYRMLGSPGQNIHKDSILDQIEKNAINSRQNLKENWRLITERNIEIWVKEAKTIDQPVDG